MSEILEIELGIHQDLTLRRFVLELDKNSKARGEAKVSLFNQIIDILEASSGMSYQNKCAIVMAAKALVISDIKDIDNLKEMTISGVVQMMLKDNLIDELKQIIDEQQAQIDAIAQALKDLSIHIVGLPAFEKLSEDEELCLD
jgi:hypothetical protein